MKQVLTDKQVTILNQLTQEDIDYIKHMVEGQKRSEELGRQECQRYRELISQVKRGTLTSDEREFHTSHPLVDPDTSELVSPPQVSAVPESP